ncbi:MAG: response regulator [Proteobacteria bacterium]|nr:response regulator [Pseudomonadota bacterium]
MSAISVMLIDDDPFICEVVAAALGVKPGIHVQSFASGDDALAAARIAAPDIIVLDYMMPGTDGLAIYRDLKSAIGAMPPVIFLTAREDADLVARLHAAGAAGVLSKPFDPSVIADEILKRGARRGDGPRDMRLDAVAASFRASLPQTMAEIDKEWSALRREWQTQVAESLVMRTHKLAGAAGLFKLHDFGNAARAVEVAAVAQVEAATRGEAVDTSAIEPAVAVLWERAIGAMGKG